MREVARPGLKTSTRRTKDRLQRLARVHKFECMNAQLEWDPGGMLGWKTEEGVCNVSIVDDNVYALLVPADQAIDTAKVIATVVFEGCQGCALKLHSQATKTACMFSRFFFYFLFREGCNKSLATIVDEEEKQSTHGLTT